jgi:hypothetical protein
MKCLLQAVKDQTGNRGQTTGQHNRERQQGTDSTFFAILSISPALPLRADLLATHPFERYLPIILFFSLPLDRRLSQDSSERIEGTPGASHQ